MASLLRRLLGGLIVLCAFSPASLAVDTAYTYDALGRLTNVTYACSASSSYAYDAAGNRSSSGSVAQSGCPPVAVKDSLTAAFNTAATFDPRANDSDPNGYPLTITAAGPPGHGAVVVNGGTSVIYTPATGYSGADSFAYTISNGHGGTASATVSVTVGGSDQPPVAVNDSATANENIPDTFDPRINDHDPDGDPITISAASTPSHGSVVVNGGISLTYTPAANYVGADSFTYTITDGHLTNSATVSVTVNAAGNQPPIANNDSITTVTSAGTRRGSVSPLANDSDPDGDTLTLVSVSGGANGTCTSILTRVSYVANEGFTGSDTCGYTISDGQGHTASATIFVTVPP